MCPSTRCCRSAGRTSSPWNTTTRRFARWSIASCCNASIGRTSAVWATLILRWSIRIPSCAISADSMLRTTRLASTSLWVRTWISLTSPCGVTTTRADSTPVRLVSRFSTRFTPHGSGALAGGVSAIGSSEGPSGVGAGLEGIKSLVSRGDLVASCGLSTIQRAVGGHQHVLRLGAGPVLRQSDARRHQRLGVAEPPPHRLHLRPHLLRHPTGPVRPGPDQHHDELVAPVARRQVGRADQRAELVRRAAQHLVPRLVAEAVV